MRSETGRRWRVLLTLATTLVFAAVTISAGNVLYPVVQPVLGLTATVLGLLASIALLARAFFGPFWGVLADKYGRTRILFVAALGAAGFVAAASVARSLRTFIALYAGALVCAVAVEPVVDSLLADFSSPPERGQAYGVSRALLNLGVAGCMPVLGFLAATSRGWRASLSVLAVAEMIAAALIVWQVPVLAERGGPPRRGSFALRLLPRLLQLCTLPLFAGTYALATSLVLLTYLPAFLNQVRGYPVDVAARMYGLLHLGGLLGSLLGGTLGDWAERRWPQQGRMRLMQVYLVTFAGFTVLIFQLPNQGALFDAALLFAFGVVLPVGFSGCVLPMLSIVIPVELRSTGFALLASFCQGLSLTLVSLAVGMLAPRYGLQRLLFCATTVPYALNAGLWFLFSRRLPADLAAAQAEAEQPGAAPSRRTANG